MLEVAGSLAQAQSCYDVRFGPNFVRFTPSNRHSGQGWECLKLTQTGRGLKIGEKVPSKATKTYQPVGVDRVKM